MTLGQKQRLFATLAATLIQRAAELGYEVTFGETWRAPEWAAEMKKRGLSRIGAASLHCDRLAIDINLFRGERYITTDEGHKELGAWWKAQHSFARWGGDFEDPNHYSLEHNGRK